MDSEGLSRCLAHDREVLELLDNGRKAGYDRVISVATLLEATHDKIDRRHWSFVLSQMRIEPFTEDLAKEAVELLRMAGLHGHKYAIDAMVAATALHQRGPVILLTSDVDDMARLCGERVELVRL